MTTANSSHLLSAQRTKELALLTINRSTLAPSQAVCLARKYKKRASRVLLPPMKKARRRVKFVDEPTVHRIPPLPKKPEGKVRMPEDEYPLRRNNVTIEGETITSPAIERRKNTRLKNLQKKLELLQRRQEEFFMVYSEKLNAIVAEMQELND